MTLNDYYYQTVAKQHAEELRAIAAEDRLAKIVRQARKQQRAERREARRLQAAVQGRTGLWHAVRTLFVPDHPATDDQQVAGTDQTEEITAEKPTPAASR